jgi:hypothetical protein
MLTHLEGLPRPAQRLGLHGSTDAFINVTHVCPSALEDVVPIPWLLSMSKRDTDLGHSSEALDMLSQSRVAGSRDRIRRIYRHTQRGPHQQPSSRSRTNGIEYDSHDT